MIISPRPIASTAVVFVSAIALTLSLLVMPTPSYAGSKRGLIGLGVGVIIGMGIAKGLNKSRRHRKYSKRSRSRSKTVRKNRSIGVSGRKNVRRVQSALANLGYYTKKVDGIGGKGTRRAISSFQSDRGFAATGKLNQSQQAILLSAAGVGATTVYNPDSHGIIASTSSNTDIGAENGEVNIFGDGIENQPVQNRPLSTANITDEFDTPKPFVEQAAGEKSLFNNDSNLTNTVRPRLSVQPGVEPEVVDSGELASIFDDQPEQNESAKNTTLGN